MKTPYTLPAGTPLAKCEQVINGQWRDCGVKTVQEPKGYLGEWMYQPAGNKQVALFSSPSFEDCAGTKQQKVDKCKLEAALGDDAVNFLTRYEFPIPPKPSPSSPPTDSKPNQAQDTNDEIRFEKGLLDYRQGPTNTPLQFLVDNALILGILSLLVALSGATLLYLRTTPSSTPKKRATRTKHRSTTVQSTSQSIQQTPAPYDLSQVHQSIQKISSRLDALEHRIDTLLSEQTASAVSSFRSAAAPLSNSAVASVPVESNLIPTPQPLSEDLIKQSVLASDYTLIEKYPHLFLNETQDSRQGKLERKTFEVMGDHTQSSSLANAEFIAIQVNTNTYLIPNLLPNAADPRRTMKRHVDSNSIYRPGSGSNMLKVDILATVDPTSGSFYELASSGAIN